MVNYHQKGEHEYADDKRRQAMAPNIHAFIMDHEKTFKYFNGSVEINPVAVSYMLIVLHIGRSLVIVTNYSLGMLLSCLVIILILGRLLCELRLGVYFLFCF
jgi:hypothetical protein